MNKNQTEEQQRLDLASVRFNETLDHLMKRDNTILALLKSGKQQDRKKATPLIQEILQDIKKLLDGLGNQDARFNRWNKCVLTVLSIANRFNLIDEQSALEGKIQSFEETLNILKLELEKIKTNWNNHFKKNTSLNKKKICWNDYSTRFLLLLRKII